MVPGTPGMLGSIRSPGCWVRLGAARQQFLSLWVETLGLFSADADWYSWISIMRWGGITASVQAWVPEPFLYLQNGHGTARASDFTLILSIHGSCMRRGEPFWQRCQARRRYDWRIKGGLQDLVWKPVWSGSGLSPRALDGAVGLSQLVWIQAAGRVLVRPSLLLFLGVRVVARRTL